MDAADGIADRLMTNGGTAIPAVPGSGSSVVGLVVVRQCR